jgi:hypothetical protein
VMTRGRKVIMSGIAFLLLTGAGSAQEGPARFAVEGTAIDVDIHGNVVILDQRQNTATLYDRSMKKLLVTGGSGWEDGQFDGPAGVWAKNSLDVYIADHGNHRIQRFDRSLSFVSSFSGRNTTDAVTGFGYPSDVSLSRMGSLFVCDTENNRIVRVDAANRVEGSFGGFGGGAGKLDRPVQVEIGPEDHVYVLDPPRVVVFDLFGNFLTTFAEGLITSPSHIAGDDRGIVVVDGTDLVFFGALQRPLLRTPVATVLGQQVDTVLSVCLSGGRLYILTPGMLHIVPDPRAGDTDGLLDKEPNNH